MADLTPDEEALVHREHFDDVTRLIRELHPLAERWHMNTLGGWILRGHWSSSWELVPSLYRKEKIEQFLAGWETWDDSLKLGPDGVATTELYLLHRVFNEFDAAGLEIPEIQIVRQFLKDNNLAYVPDDLVPFVALAQHRGVPTRLLDWSTQGKVAAYFAAADAVHQTARNANLEIIAINVGAVSIANILNKDQLFRIVHAPRSSNSNLHAQSGVFTVCNGEYPKTPLDKLVLATLAGGQAKPVIQRLTFPQAQAGQLLEHLHYEGVSGATMFPGYDGAVKRLKEWRSYHKPYSTGTLTTPFTV